MGCFVRKKKDGENEYFYEVTTTYDPSIKRSRQKVKYLGKNIDGKPTRIRTCTPQRSFNYGELIPAMAVMKELGIGDMLDGILNEYESRAVQVMAFNRVLRPLPSLMLESWYESSYLCKMYPGLKLKSQQASELLERIGSNDVPEQFMDRLTKAHSKGSALVFDITSLSSHSNQIDLLEYGYNREHNSLEQVNLGMVVDKKTGLPLMYDLYPGSIVDVLTLVNTLKRIRARGITEYSLVLDRGFFSKSNIRELIREKASFIIPANHTLKNVKELISACKDIKNPCYLQKFNDKIIYVKQVQLDIDGILLNGFLYYSPSREQDEKEGFMSRLYDVRSKLEEKELQSWMKPQDTFESITGSMQSFFSYKVENNHFVVEIKNNAVVQRLNKMGRFLLLYHETTPSWDECLSMYKEKDIVEKAFKILKSDVRLKPLNVKKTETLKGLLFTCFIALSIRMRLLRLMKEKGLLKDYTIESMHLELEKVKKIELENGEIITTEPTKKVKTILKTLNLEI
jgi:transposase